MTHSKALDAAADAVAEFRRNITRTQRSVTTSSDFTFAHAAIAAFLAKLHENTDPEETARYCLLGQLRKEISNDLQHVTE